MVKDIVAEFYKQRCEIEIPLLRIKSDLSQFDSIVLYGAGSAGIAFLHYLIDAGIQPTYFSDGDVSKHWKEVEGMTILPPSDIVKTVGDNCLVIVTINTDGEHYCKDFKAELLKGGHKGVHKTLRDFGCRNVIDYTFFRRCYGLFQNEKYNLPACSDVYMMLENVDKLEDAYELLDDEETKDTYKKIIEFRMLSDEIDIPIFSERDMYFEYDLFPKTNEAFVDCGACGGSSLDGFLIANNNKFDEYYGIEPDLTNYLKLEKKIEGYDSHMRERMHIVNAAAWNTDDNQTFFVLHGPGTFQADIGPDIVKTIKIDSFLNGKNATYIKMNIEGSEIPALEGARDTIIKYKPRLAIMGYHKTSDLWEVPLLIKKYRQDYNLRLRSYMKNIAFAYYAF